MVIPAKHVPYSDTGAGTQNLHTDMETSRRLYMRTRRQRPWMLRHSAGLNPDGSSEEKYTYASSLQYSHAGAFRCRK